VKRWIKWLVIAAAVVLALMAGVGLVLRSLVGGSAKDRLVAALSEKMGVPVAVDSVDFDFSSWFRLRPAVTLENVSVGNPPGFRSKNLFEARKISAQVSLGALLHKAIDVRSFEIDQPRIVVETNPRGLTNIGELLSKVASGRSAAAGPSLAVDELSITSGSLAISEAVNVQGIDIRLSNFSTDRRCRLTASAKLFGGHNSSLTVDAQAGPFGSESLPLDGTLTLTVAPAEIPAGLRREQFGNLLGSPGNKAKTRLEASIKGDLYSTLSGPAKLVLTDVLIGKDPDHVLSLSGETPSTLSVSNLMASPRLALNVPNARLQLGKGEWSGAAEFQSRGSASSGEVRGAIRNVDINELLGSFTSANDKMNGLLAIPSFALRFSGKDADAVRKSLNGNGRLSVTQGHIRALDLLATIERALGQTGQATPGAKGTTPFNTLTADLNIGQSRIEVGNLVLDGPALRATGNGVIGFDQSLDFNLTAHVSGGLAQMVNTVSMHSPSNDADLPVSVTGTVASPQVRPSIKKIATGVVQGLLDSFLKKKQK